MLLEKIWTPCTNFERMDTCIALQVCHNQTKDSNDSK